MTARRPPRDAIAWGLYDQVSLADARADDAWEAWDGTHVSPGLRRRLLWEMIRKHRTFLRLVRRLHRLSTNLSKEFL